MKTHKRENIFPEKETCLFWDKSELFPKEMVCHKRLVVVSSRCSFDFGRPCDKYTKREHRRRWFRVKRKIKIVARALTNVPYCFFAPLLIIPILWRAINVIPEDMIIASPLIAKMLPVVDIVFFCGTGITIISAIVMIAINIREESHWERVREQNE
jgi:hypothetical protein